MRRVKVKALPKVVGFLRVLGWVKSGSISGGGGQIINEAWANSGCLKAICKLTVFLGLLHARSGCNVTSHWKTLIGSVLCNICICKGGGDDLEKKFPASLYIMNKKISALTNWGGGGISFPSIWWGKKCCKTAWLQGSKISWFDFLGLV